MNRPTKEERDLIVKEMLEYHKPTFGLLGVEKPLFYPKTTFEWQGNTYISLYERELTSGSFFTELCDESYQPLDKSRQLHRWRGNPNHISEYHKAENGVGERYYVPVEELEKVDVKSFIKGLTGLKVSHHEPPPFDLEGLTGKGDANMSTMTIRDYCAIVWKLPLADKAWLNKLIQEQFAEKPQVLTTRTRKAVQ